MILKTALRVILIILKICSIQKQKLKSFQVRDLDPTNELTFLRVKSLKHEVKQ